MHFNKSILTLLFVCMTLLGCSKQYVGVKKNDIIEHDPSYSAADVIQSLSEGKTSDEDFVFLTNNIKSDFKRYEFWDQARTKLVVDKPWIDKIFAYRPTCESSQKTFGFEKKKSINYFLDYVKLQTLAIIDNSKDHESLLRNIQMMDYVLKHCVDKSTDQSKIVLTDSNKWMEVLNGIQDKKIVLSLKEEDLLSYYSFVFELLNYNLSDFKFEKENEDRKQSKELLRNVFTNISWSEIYKNIRNCETCTQNEIDTLIFEQLPSFFYRDIYREKRYEFLEDSNQKTLNDIFIYDSQVNNFLISTTLSNSQDSIDFISKSMHKVDSRHRLEFFNIFYNTYSDKHKKIARENGFTILNSLELEVDFEKSSELLTLITKSNADFVDYNKPTLNASMLKFNDMLVHAKCDLSCKSMLVKTILMVKNDIDDIENFSKEVLLSEILEFKLERDEVIKGKLALIFNDIVSRETIIKHIFKMNEDRFFVYLNTFKSLIFNNGQSLESFLIQLLNIENHLNISYFSSFESFSRLESVLKSEVMISIFKEFVSTRKDKVIENDQFISRFMSKKEITFSDKMELFNLYALPESSREFLNSNEQKQVWHINYIQHLIKNPEFLKLFRGYSNERLKLFRDIFNHIKSKFSTVDKVTKNEFSKMLGSLLTYYPMDMTKDFIKTLAPSYMALSLKNALKSVDGYARPFFYELDKELIRKVKKSWVGQGTFTKLKTCTKSEIPTEGVEPVLYTHEIRMKCIINVDQRMCNWDSGECSDSYEKSFCAGNPDNSANWNLKNNKWSNKEKYQSIQGDPQCSGYGKSNFEWNQSKADLVAKRKEILSTLSTYYSEMQSYDLANYSEITQNIIGEYGGESCHEPHKSLQRSYMENFGHCYKRDNNYAPGTMKRSLLIEVLTKTDDQECNSNGCFNRNTNILTIDETKLNFFSVIKLENEELTPNVLIKRSKYSNKLPKVINNKFETLEVEELRE